MRKAGTVRIRQTSFCRRLVSETPIGHLSCAKIRPTGFSEALEKKVAPLGIVTSVEPGIMRTDWVRASYWDFAKPV